MLVSRFLPYSVKLGIKKFRHSKTGGVRFCPVCQSTLVSFGAAGGGRRPDARCRVCASLERHRFVWLYFERCTHLLNPDPPQQMLHIAPEPQISRKLRKVKQLDYLSGDLHGHKAMVAVDITNMQFPDESFDYIYCSHVLEHVEEDRRALREFYRVLRPGGLAILMVPIFPKKYPLTFEDFSIRDPQDRERVFGQHNHVRICGLDYSERMEEAGFKVQTLRPFDLLSRDEMVRFAVPPNESPIFACSKS